MAVVMAAAAAAAALLATPTAAFKVVEYKTWGADSCGGSPAGSALLYASDGGCTSQGSVSGASYRVNCTGGVVTTFSDGKCQTVASTMTLAPCTTTLGDTANTSVSLQCVNVAIADVYTVEAFSDSKCSKLLFGTTTRYNACVRDPLSGSYVSYASGGNFSVSTFDAADTTCANGTLSTSLVPKSKCTSMGNFTLNGQLTSVFVKVSAGVPWVASAPTSAPSSASGVAQLTAGVVASLVAVVAASL